MSTQKQDTYFCIACGCYVFTTQNYCKELRDHCNICGHKVTTQIESVIDFEDEVFDVEVPRRWYQETDQAESHKVLIKYQCPKCKGEYMRFWNVQTRSADEGESVFYECVDPKCNYRIKEDN